MLNLAAALATASLFALAGPAAPPAPIAPAAPRAMTYFDDAPHEVPTALNWQVDPAEAADAAPGQVRFELGYRIERQAGSDGHSYSASSSHSSDMALSLLGGLTAAQLAGPGQSVAFTLHRDAGEFRCKGVVAEGRGIGTCAYAADAQFPAALARRGVTGGLEPYQQFQLTLTDIGFAYLDELKRQTYATPTTTDLVRAGTHGAGMKHLLAMNAAGYRFGDVATLVRLRDHGINARYVEGLKDAGYAHLAAEDLQKMRDHGVSTTYIADLQKAGYTGLKAEDLVHLRDHGVSSAFIAELHAMGYEHLTADQLARMRDHGISPGFVRVANQSGERLSPDDLIRLRDEGGPRRDRNRN